MQRLIVPCAILLFSLLLTVAGCTSDMASPDAAAGIAPTVAITSTLVNTTTMTATAVTTTPVAVDNPLANTNWQLVAFGEPGEEEPVVGETIPTLAFDAAGRVSGSGGCNTFGGDYQMEGNMLAVSQLTSTRMACAEAVMTQEVRYLAALEATTQVEFVREHLRLSADDGEVLNLIQSGSGATPVTGTPTVIATATMTLPAGTPITVTATVTAPTGGEVGTCTWKAIHNLQPPGPATLTVSGLCTMPTSGYTLTLSRAEPQGINPAILLLNLTVAAPTDIVTQVVTPTEVVYTEETDQPFDQVTILADEGMEGTIDVEEVQ